MGQFTENKMLFVNEHLHNETTRPSYLRILGKFASREEELQKDLYNFDENDILKVLEKDKFTQTQLQTVFKKYIEWVESTFSARRSMGITIL